MAESAAAGASAPGPASKCWTRAAGEVARVWSHLARTLVLVFPVYALGYLELSACWLLLGLALLFMWRRRRARRSERARREAEGGERAEEHCELPAWVHFPDVERVEWLNKTVKQMWPYVCQFVEKLFRETIEPAVKGVNSHLSTFTFTKIDLGDKPLRVNGVKVYTENVDKRQIIMDLQISFVANTEIDVDIKRYYCKAGIKSIQLHGVLRVVLEPLLGEMPLVGAFSLFFLKKPLVDISWTGLTNILDIPGLNGFSDNLIQDIIYSYLVLPNRITIPLVGDVELSQLRFPMPKGVLRIHFLEAQDLEGKDKFLGGLIKGKSDPYGVLHVANQLFQSKTIKECLNPKWNEVFEAMVYEHPGQHLEIELFDEDPDKDDFLGSLMIDLTELHKELKVDEWFDLEEVSSGKLHLRLEWLSLHSDAEKLDQALRSMRNNDSLSSALLVVHLDSARNLPSEQLEFNADAPKHPYRGLLKSGRKVNSDPSPYVQLTVGQKTYESKVRYKTCEPLWEEAFSFLVHNPRTQELQVEVRDDKHKCMLGSVRVPLAGLLADEEMTLTQQFPLCNSGPSSSLKLKLALRILCLEKETASGRPSAVQIRRASQCVSSATAPPQSSTANSASTTTTRSHSVQTRTHTPPSASGTPSPAAPLGAPQGQRGSEGSPVRLAQAGRSTSSSGLSCLTRQQQNHRDSMHSLASDTSLPSATLELQNRLTQLQNGSASAQYPLGEVQLTIRHSSHRNKLIVVVHACRNLIALGKDSSDPYIRLYLLPDKSRSGRRKTSTMRKTLNPIYDQSFEFIVSVVELHRRTLDVAVKNGGGLLSKHKGLLGKVLVDLTNEDISRGWTQWYDLNASGP
ncbi:LOW QUALITY PROTEIN: extended synaptotagmin-2 [Colossoma macropomum]|uniref:LOW QUALITY PROTEIN: extended synaptotagmin-2 n=1 Tax=Colossoma macropomum TaxID=42526 RepID=UPI0018647FAE|nr:LOW QUALITY PROTEIN: extended synaptotagmin-2 [Colossoma macropomum]